MRERKSHDAEEDFPLRSCPPLSRSPSALRESRGGKSVHSSARFRVFLADNVSWSRFVLTSVLRQLRFQYIKAKLPRRGLEKSISDSQIRGAHDENEMNFACSRLTSRGCLHPQTETPPRPFPSQKTDSSKWRLEHWALVGHNWREKTF
jgi:hypothetical protein